jgi:hypothetical protein
MSVYFRGQKGVSGATCDNLLLSPPQAVILGALAKGGPSPYHIGKLGKVS